ncbi:MAG TPA: FUSC family protein [Bryobacteraceae bacterium]
MSDYANRRLNRGFLCFTEYTRLVDITREVQSGAPSMKSSPSRALWKTTKRVDRSKLNSRWMALRNSLAVALPLGAGIATDHPLVGVAVTTGALNVSYSDGRDPYAQRARRMLAWSVLGAIAVFTGSVTGKYHVAAITMAAAWAFIAGMLMSISTRAGDLGLNTLVILIVFAARGALSPKGALAAASLALAGGLLQTLFALLLWPVHRYAPECRAIGKVYRDLSEEVNPHNDVVAATPLNPQPADVQDVLSALGRDHSVEGERFRLLFDQADRLRLSVYALNRLRAESQHEARRHGSMQFTSDSIDEILQLTAELLGKVGEGLLSGEPIPGLEKLTGNLDSSIPNIHIRKKEQPSPLISEIASAVDALAGQLRLIVQLAVHATPSGMEEFSKHELEPPWKLRVTGWVATLRANLDLDSGVCRHAIRLAICVALADAIGRSISWERSYWLPMTAAVVLKPDFAATISRGVLRLLGTYAGLLFATLLYHVLPQSAATHAILVGIFTFFLRWLGPANYGVFSVAVSGLIVFLIAETGVPPSQAVLQRFLNTSAGGVFALCMYALWPTWERKAVADAMADMLDACRNYFQAVAQRLQRDDPRLEETLDETRREWRRVRSSAEASVDRVLSEPGISPGKADCLTSMLASSHALVHAVMGLEAGATQLLKQPPAEAFETFAIDVEFTLYFLAAALRGSRAAAQELPKLREDHRRLIEAREAFSPAGEFLLMETDRLTVSLNTLSEQVLRYLA